MSIDFNRMDGYEFEGFIANLLRKIGFIVDETSLSGDGGVDLIANSEEPLYRGKYLVQCKCWKGNVGESVVRDLYGTVISNNANKGILITNSFFTKQATNFAEGKNIELINGNILNELIYKYLDSDSLSSPSNNVIYKTHFSKIGEFESEKYKYLKHLVDTNKRNYYSYLDFFRFIYAYILDKKFEIMYSGLIEECLSLTDEIIKRFGAKEKKSENITEVFIAIKGTLLMLLGKIDDSFETILIAKRINFYYSRFNKSEYFYFNPAHFDTNPDGFTEISPDIINKIIDSEFIIYKANLFNLLMQINDDYSSEWLYEKFMNYYNNIITKSRYSMSGPMFQKNIKIVKKQIEFVKNKKELKIFTPIYLSFDNTFKNPGYCVEYSSDSYINIEDIAHFWGSELNFDNQKKKIKLLISFIE